jgi:hypothetical protein
MICADFPLRHEEFCDIFSVPNQFGEQLHRSPDRIVTINRVKRFGTDPVCNLVLVKIQHVQRQRFTVTIDRDPGVAASLYPRSNRHPLFRSPDEMVRHAIVVAVPVMRANGNSTTL